MVRKPVESCGTILSFPRSGSSYLRYLLEGVTGYSTMDIKYLLSKEEGSVINYDSDKCIAIKSHFLESMTNHKKVVFLQRNPLDALVSHTSRYISFQVSETIKTQKENDPLSPVKTFRISWTQSMIDNIKYHLVMYENMVKHMTWRIINQQPVMVLNYDYLVKNPKNSIWKVINFLDPSISKNDCDLSEKNINELTEKSRHIYGNKEDVWVKEHISRDEVRNFIRNTFGSDKDVWSKCYRYIMSQYENDLEFMINTYSKGTCFVCG